MSNKGIAATEVTIQQTAKLTFQELPGTVEAYADDAGCDECRVKRFQLRAAIAITHNCEASMVLIVDIARRRLTESPAAGAAHRRRLGVAATVCRGPLHSLPLQPSPHNPLQYPTANLKSTPRQVEVKNVDGALDIEPQTGPEATSAIQAALKVMTSSPPHLMMASSPSLAMRCFNCFN
jgi:hypothetical protein